MADAVGDEELSLILRRLEGWAVVWAQQYGWSEPTDVFSAALEGVARAQAQFDQARGCFASFAMRAAKQAVLNDLRTWRGRRTLHNEATAREYLAKWPLRTRVCPIQSHIDMIDQLRRAPTWVAKVLVRHALYGEYSATLVWECRQTIRSLA